MKTMFELRRVARGVVSVKFFYQSVSIFRLLQPVEST
jgi:hypothetical protein